MAGKFLPISLDRLSLVKTILENRLPNSATIFNIAKLSMEARYSQNVTPTFFTYDGIIDDKALIIVVLHRKFPREEDRQVTFSAAPSLTLSDRMPSQMLSAFENIMDWTVPIAFCSVDDRVASYIQLTQMCSRNGTLADSDLCHLYVCESHNALKLDISNNECQDLIVSTLSTKDAQTVTDYWNYSGKGVAGLEKMKDVITNIGSAGIYVKKSSKSNEEAEDTNSASLDLVSWVVTSHVGCINALFTHPDHRRKGYGKMVMEAITKFNVQDGLQPTVQISRNNHASKDLMEQIGYVYSHPMMWVIFRPRMVNNVGEV